MPASRPTAPQSGLAQPQQHGAALKDGVVALFGLLGRGIGIGLRYPEHRRWLRVVGSETTAEVLRRYPRLAYRHSTTYLFQSATWRTRLRLLIAHYRFTNEVFDAATFNRLLSPSGLTVWRPEPSREPHRITLHGPCLVSRHREGEMSLKFWREDVPLYTVAFSIVQDVDGPGQGLFVGQVQGSEGNLDLVRGASRSCHDVHPRDMLMSGLEGLARAWGVPKIFGVSDGEQLSKQGRTPPPFAYDAFWTSYRGQKSHGYFSLPLPFHNGQLTSQSSAHRRRSRGKRAFLAAVRDEIARSMAAEMRSGAMPPRGG